MHETERREQRVFHEFTPSHTTYHQPTRLPPFATEQSARLQKESFTQLEDALLALNMERSQVGLFMCLLN